MELLLEEVTGVSFACELLTFELQMLLARWIGQLGVFRDCEWYALLLRLTPWLIVFIIGSSLVDCRERVCFGELMSATSTR